MGISIAQLSAQLSLDAKQFNAQLDRTNKGVRGFTNVIGSLNKAVGVALVGALAAGTAALAGFGASTVKVGAEFQKAVAQIAAVKGFRNINDQTSEAGQRMQEFIAEARRLGATTAYSATEAAEGMQQLARAGLETNQVIQATGPALFLAGASAADMSSATTLLASTMKQFQLSSNEASRIADVFTIAQQKSLFAMDSLTEAMKYAGTIGNAFSMSLEETTAAVALFRDLGVEGSQAGTQFRQAMISLANPTAKAKKTLKAYGLTVQDVNPEVKSFEEIMRTLAAANMDMASITNLVSKRASGSIMTITNAFADGTTKYNELIEAFENGGGAAEGTYNTMIDNVAGRFDILKSAFQELQLTVFDTFSAGLKDALGEGDGGLIGLVNTMTEAFQYSAGTFQEAFGSILGDTMAAINENQAEIAATIIVTVQRVVELGVAFIKLVPTLITIGKVMASLWVANKVRLMTVAVVQFAAGIKAASVGLGVARAAMAALVASSGGILALVAAVATLALAFSTFAASSSKAAAAQAQLTANINESKRAVGEFNTKAAQAQMAGLANAAEAFSDIRAKLAQEDDTDAKIIRGLDSQLKALEALEEKEQKRKILKGQLAQYEIEGAAVLLDYATALELTKTELGENNNLMEQMAAKEQEYIDQKNQATEASQATFAALKEAKKILKQYEDGTISWLEAAVPLEEIMDNNNIQYERNLNNFDKMTTAIGKLDTKLSGLQSTATRARDMFKGFTSEMQTALAHEAEAMEKERARQAKADKKAEAQRKARARSRGKDRAKEYDNLRKQRIKAEEQLQRAVEVLMADAGSKEAVKLQQRFAKQRELYDKELAFIGRNTQKRLALEQDYFNQLGSMYIQATQQKFDQLNQELADAQEANKRFGASQIQQIENQTKDEIASIRERTEALSKVAEATAAEATANLEQQLDQRLISYEEFEAEVEDVFKRQAVEFGRIQDLQNDLVEEATERGANRIAQINKEMMQEIQQSREEILKKGVVEELKIIQEREIEKLKAEGASQATLRAQRSLHNMQIQQAEEDLSANLVQPFGKYTEKIDELQKKSAKAFTESSKARYTKEIEYLVELAALEQKLSDVRTQTQGADPDLQADAIARVQQEIENLNASYGKSQSLLGMMGQAGVKAFSSIVQGAKAALDAIIGFAGKAADAIGGAISSGLSFFTGGAVTTDIMGMLSQAATAAGEAQAGAREQLAGLDQALASGDITKAEYDEAVAGGVGQVDPAAQAADFINELISKAVDFAKAIASQAPVILTELGAQLPILIDALKVAIPEVVLALGEQLPVVVTALIYGIIDMLPVLADALINDALPNIVTALVTLITDAIPRLAGELDKIFTDLLTFLVDAVGQLVGAIVAALPSVVDFLVSAITDLLTSIPELLKMLLAAIPVIITELLGGVAELVSAVFNAIPMILNEVILALPNIIKALIEGLLGVLIEIANALPDLITQLILLLPELLTALLELLPEIIIALVEALPLIIMGIIKGLPQIISALINLIPLLIMAIIKALPMLVAVIVKSVFQLVLVELPILVLELVTQVLKGIAGGIVDLFENIGEFLRELPEKLREAFAFIKELPSMIGDAVMNGLKKLVQFFKDVITEIVTLGMTETETFGDTPEAIRAGPTGLTANFAPDDYVIAAQKPIELLRQAVGALGAQGSASLTSAMARSFPPTMTSESEGAGGGSTTTSINIVAEGRLLDSITMRALDRGHAPELEKKLKRNKGATVGFSRGRFNKFGAK